MKQKSVVNRKANQAYEQVQSIEVGMVLKGTEIKAIRAGHMQLTGSYGRLLIGPNGPELWLVGAQFFGVTGDKQRSVKLLAHRREVDRLAGLVGQRGYTLIPRKVFFSKGRAKLELAISRGLKQFEKRAKLREKTVIRDIARTLRQK
jgi:SsrA-binding protein